MGFNNRGIKYLVEHKGKHLGELESTKMESIIIEVCFVESKIDVDVYKNKGYKQVARAIANGLDNRVNLTAENIVKIHRNCVVYANDVDKREAEYLND